MLAAAGPLTATPLLLFGGAARRLPLSVIGMLQYVTPILQLTVGVLVFREPMPPERWAGFILVWVAIAILTVEGYRHRRRVGAHLLDPRGANPSRRRGDRARAHRPRRPRGSPATST